MNELDILVDVDLLEEQYRFLLSRHNSHWWNYESEGLKMPAHESELWEGIFNLFENILETYKPLDIPRVIVVE